MQKIIFSVLLFLMLFCNTSVGETTTETHVWEEEVSFSDNYDIGASGTQSNRHSFNVIGTTEISDIQGMYFASASFDTSKIMAGSFPKKSDYFNVQFKIGSDVLGTGIAGYSKGQNRIFFNYWIQSDGGLQPGTYTGQQQISVYNLPGYTGTQTVGYGQYSGFPNYLVMPLRDIGSGNYYWGGGNIDVHYYTYQYFYNEIEICDDAEIVDITITRSSGNKSKFVITDSFDDLMNESAFSYEVIELYTVNPPVDFSGINLFDHEFEYIYDRVAAGAIEFNQTYYTNPEPVGVEYNINGMNTGDYEYWINIEDYENGGIINYEYIELTESTGQANFTLWTGGSELPMEIRAILYTYSKNTGVTSEIGYSEIVVYNPTTISPGSVWMDQAVYDTGDTATVNYETSSNAAYVIVRKYPKAVWSQGEYYIWNVPIGSGTRTFVIPPSGTGDWKAELSESDVTVNETMFSVNETTTPFLAWDDIDGIIGESQILHFYSNDVNATLQIYDADQTVIYDETVGDGYFENYAISTHTNQAPGTWTASLNCSGSYYNDTLLMYAKDAYVSFDADSYTLGQTISIQYYLKRSTQSIVLYDSNNQDIITWTTAGNYIHHGIGTGSVDFTLSDDNEYGLNVVSGVDAGNIKLGLWKVEVLDRGQPIADNPVYDSAKVSESIDDPADTSNEMISIFFSPEGVFLLFTVCLTMMGLVLSHHPAGGGAGAVVGVGFGVYFNVLPPWILMLMVITLVVLAGVSIAVYFKGK